MKNKSALMVSSFILAAGFVACSSLNSQRNPASESKPDSPELAQYLEQYRPKLEAFKNLEAESIDHLNPFYNGRLFVLAPLPFPGIDSPYKTDIISTTRFITETIVTTEVIKIPGTPGGFSDWSGWNWREGPAYPFGPRNWVWGNWRNARADFLNVNGLVPNMAAGYAQADSEWNTCVGSGGDCSGMNLETTRFWGSASGQIGPNTDTSEYRRREFTDNIDRTGCKPTDTRCGTVSREQRYQERTRDYTEPTPDREERITKEEQTSKEEQQQEEKRRREKVRLKLSLAPILFFDIWWTNTILSQNPQLDGNTFALNREEGEKIFSEVPQLRKADSNKPFKLIKRSNVSAGAGIGVSMSPTNLGLGSALSGNVGFAVLGGSERITERLADNRQEAYRLGHLNVPSNEKSVLNWNPGDKLTWASNGGVLFLAGPSWMGLSANATYLARGTWTSMVEKVGPQQVYLKVSKAKLNSFGLVAGALITQVSQQSFRNIDSSFSYLFDLSRDGGREAFDHALAGSFVKAQNLDRAKSGEVIHVDDVVTASQGRMQSLGLGLPFMGWQKGEGKFHASQFTDFAPDGTEINAEYGVYMQTEDSRFFNRFRNENVAFYGMDARTKTADGKESSVQGAQFGYSFTKTNASRDDLQKVVKNVIRATGMAEELSVKMPQNVDNLGSASLNFVLTLDESATQLLMDLATDPQRADVFKKIHRGFVSSYFKKGDRLDLCTGIQVPNCASVLNADALKGLAQMQVALKKMKAAKGSNPKAFARAYAEFGEGMLANAFTFQTVLSLVKGRGAVAKYTVSSTNTDLYDLRFAWNPALRVAETSASGAQNAAVGE